MTRFYSYLWLREDGSPYYAGKGSGRRAFHTSHGVHRPSDRTRILIFPMLNETDAFESEIALIDLFGRKDIGTGCLRNLTDGGEGSAGAQASASRKARVSEFMKGNQYAKGNHRVVPADELARRVATRRLRNNYRKKGYKLTASHKAKIGISHRGIGHTVETRAKLSVIALAREARKRSGVNYLTVAKP